MKIVRMRDGDDIQLFLHKDDGSGADPILIGKYRQPPNDHRGTGENIALCHLKGVYYEAGVKGMARALGLGTLKIVDGEV